MTDDEYRKAREFYKFLVNITKCNNGVLTIERKKLIDIASAYMECTPVEAYTIINKMHKYGWIKTLDKDYIHQWLLPAVEFSSAGWGLNNYPSNSCLRD